MLQYEKRILNGLLDSYENSRLFTGENKINIRIAYPFTPKTMPEYFDESSVEYEKIHEILAGLQKKGYIEVVWRQGTQIVRKVLLVEQSLLEIYAHLKRGPKRDSIVQTLRLLEELRNVCRTPVCENFLKYLTDRLEAGESVNEYIDVSDGKRTEQLIRALSLVESNQETFYIREFSIRHFGDSKVFEEMMSWVAKVMRRFGAAYESMDVYAILAEHFIYNTPNYVYLKGSLGVLEMGEAGIPLKTLKQGIGISGEDIEKIRLKETEGIKKVITIENLTTFFRWWSADSILVYLGGYHNSVRRRLLQIIYQAVPEAQYLHFGDIDAGGFEIYEDLCRKTGISFQTYRMDLKTLVEYRGYARKLTDNDRKRIAKLKERDNGYREVLEYMLEEGVKLEQECVGE